MTKRMMILIAGPYRSGTDNDPVRMAANLQRLETVASPIFEKGHVPMIDEWAALPILRGAGGGATGSATHDRVMHPTAHRLLAKCDGVLRRPGASAGADSDIHIAQARGIPVWTWVDAIPQAWGTGSSRRKDWGKLQAFGWVDPENPRFSQSSQFAPQSFAFRKPAGHGHIIAK